MTSPSPRLYLEPLSEEKHSEGIHELWFQPGNLAGTYEKNPRLAYKQTNCATLANRLPRGTEACRQPPISRRPAP